MRFFARSLGTLSLTLAAASAAAETTPAGQGSTILILPYQAVFRSAPEAKLEAATKLLEKELKNRSTLKIVRAGGSEAENAARTRGLAEAEAQVERARKAETERDIALAIECWNRALSAYETHAALLADITPYLEALHQTARAHLMAGDDAAGKQRLAQAARMAPNFVLAPDKYSRLHRLWFTQAAEAALKEPTGELFVSSTLPSAEIELDGRKMDVAPIILERVVPGKHLVRGSIDGSTAFGALVEVAPRARAEVIATFGATTGGREVGQVSAALAHNGVPKDAVLSAAAAGRDAQAGFVAFGALAKNEDRFRVYTFLVDVSTQKLTQLPTVSYDLELLTAETDVLKIAQAIYGALEKFPTGEGAIAQLEPGMKPKDTVRRVSAAPEAVRKILPAKAAQKPLKRMPLRQLQGGTVEIKDEEE